MVCLVMASLGTRFSLSVTILALVLAVYQATSPLLNLDNAKLEGSVQSQ